MNSMTGTRSLVRIGRETSNLQVVGSNPTGSSTIYNLKGSTLLYPDIYPALCFYTYTVSDFTYILREQRPCTMLYCPTCNCSILVNEIHRNIVRFGYTTARFLDQIWCECNGIPALGYIQYFFMIDDNYYTPEQGSYIRTLPRRVKDIEFIKKRWIYIEPPTT